MGDQTTFNIIGSCVSRNAFNVAFGKDLKVTGYLQRNFILDLFNPMPEESKITDKEVLEYDSHKFNLRNIRFLVNGDGIDFILSRKGEWLLIDSFYAGAECSELVFPDGHIKYIQSDFVHILKKIFKNNPRYDGFRYRSVRARENFDIRIDKAVDFIKKNWGDKVILVNVQRTGTYISYGGTADDNGERYVSSNMAATHFADLLADRLDCHRIDLPDPVLGDEYNDFRLSPVHYISEVERYLKECIDLITEGGGRDKVEEGLEKLYRLYGDRFRDIQELRKPSWNNTLCRVKKMLDAGKDYGKALELCNTLIMDGCTEANIPLSMMYLKGYGVEKDRNMFETLLERSPDKVEVFDILDPLLASGKHPGRISGIVHRDPDKVDVGKCGKLGKMFVLGESVPKDANLASKLLIRAVRQGQKGYTPTMLGALWADNSVESLELFVRYGEKYATKGDKRTIARLMKIYSGSTKLPGDPEKLERLKNRK